ncbi:YceI family protein [Methylomicrobium lacus]|uniref:YceI family protein n=1 Tax=Methylomicrobium lacus TaxID=136992 RepID=UPI00045E68B7|nr:YceI family protein [Methylomicrobium lacus]
MHPKLLASIFAGALSFSATAADNYTVDPRHTFPSFEIDHLGFSIQRGRFNQTEGKITLAPASASGSIDIAIDAASISTGLADLEKHLRGEDFLDVARFPKILFKSKQLTFDKEKLVGADGDLTLHGVTQPVHLTVDRFHCGVNLISMKNVCGANATTTIKRSDFGVDKYAPALADEVKVSIQIEAIKD